MDITLIRKYNVAGPRYTSYPTVPYWENENFSSDKWKEKVLETFQKTNADGISLYIHLPFCEKLCTYCGCNTRITINHKVEEPYIETVLKEWNMYVDLFPTKPKIKEIHLGGGTPTFFSSENLERLISGIFEKAERADGYEFGLEGHPNYTKPEQLQKLYDLGFRRLSFGIQDFDQRVQEIVNRPQSFEQVKSITEAARKIGFASVNYDLIYGLPLQTRESIIGTIEKVRQLKPDRIAFYSYAHVPWLKPGQRKFTELDLPKDEEKRALYELGRTMLEEAGYIEIGMDHFGLKNDSLYQATLDKTLHRNFMGYTTAATKLMVGLGVSSIGDSWNAFAQNVKVFEEYVRIVGEGHLPVFKGHPLTEEDLILRQHILNIMCRFETSWKNANEQHASLYEGIERLQEMVNDGLLELEPYELRVTEKGRSFVRNICMALDARLWRNQPQTAIF
ncbi:MAG: oxygen-independent coproporphyrinogen III oxidase, partial [Bacteroidetes bacterium]|nr:oxygen-independent coproporphyrinogen III oxidase [Bacteroidota bacterium]